MTTRKYTPPTCTLEVITKKPLLGHSKKDAASEPFQFKLRFDDPRLPEEEYVTVEGDRTQLESLSQTVISYVRDFLNNSAWFDTLSPDRDRSKSLHPAPDEIYIKPDGLLYHDLFLGALATQNSGPFVHLSSLQLFDLLTALEDCKNAVNEVGDRQFSFRFKPLILVRTLLMIFISIGALTGIIELINFYRQPPAEPLAASPEETEPAPIPSRLALSDSHSRSFSSPRRRQFTRSGYRAAAGAFAPVSRTRKSAAPPTRSECSSAGGNDDYRTGTPTRTPSATREPARFRTG